jgi:hypothetical protein
MTFSSRPAKPIVEEIINSIEADDDDKSAPAYRRDAAEADAPIMRDAWLHLRLRLCRALLG